MQKLTFTLFIILFSIFSLTAQQHNKRERLKAYKTAYITEKLDLSSSEAEKFWPVYNAYSKSHFQLKVLKVKEELRKIKEKGGIDELTDKEAGQILSKLNKNEQLIINLRKELYNNLKNIISAKKILKLNRAEHEFNRKLLSEYRRNKPMGDNR